MPLIFLVGPRACGKTTVGRALARRLGLPFADTDHYLHSRTGSTVAQIVAAEGWPGFRRRESEALRQLAAQHQSAGAVIATGGGMVLDAQNRAFMREQGRVLYLSASAEALAARLAGNPLASQRPSLTGTAIIDEVAQILQERLPLYEQTAHHSLDAALSPGRICTLAAALLRGPDGPCKPGEPDGSEQYGTDPSGRQAALAAPKTGNKAGSGPAAGGDAASE